MQRLQHEAVAAERHHDRRRIERAVAVTDLQLVARIAGELRRRGGEGNRARREVALPDRRDGDVGNIQTRFRCSSTGMSRRTRVVTVWSIRAVAQPVPSETFATVWPQGSQIIEWP